MGDCALAESEREPVAHTGFHQRQLLSGEFAQEPFSLHCRHSHGILHQKRACPEERDIDLHLQIGAAQGRHMRDNADERPARFLESSVEDQGGPRLLDDAQILQHAVRLVHEFDFAARQQPVPPAQMRGDGDLAFVRNFHEHTLRDAGENRKRHDR